MQALYWLSESGSPYKWEEVEEDSVCLIKPWNFLLEIAGDCAVVTAEIQMDFRIYPESCFTRNYSPEICV